MSRRLRQTGLILAVSALLAAVPGGCRREPGTEVLRQAWKLVGTRQIDEAVPQAKEYLSWHPEDAAAHYVLGQCYLHRSEVNTTLAKGEFETALHYFEKNGDLGIFAPEMTAALFQSALHRDIALALMRAVYEADNRGLAKSALYSVLEQALRQVREGLRLDPSSGFLLDMEHSLEELRAGRSVPAPLPQTTATPPGGINI